MSTTSPPEAAAAIKGHHVELHNGLRDSVNVLRVGELRHAGDLITSVSEASAILALFESHLAKENNRLIPALRALPDVSLGDLLAGVHELVG